MMELKFCCAGEQGELAGTCGKQATVAAEAEARTVAHTGKGFLRLSASRSYTANCDWPGSLVQSQNHRIQKAESREAGMAGTTWDSKGSPRGQEEGRGSGTWAFGLLPRVSYGTPSFQGQRATLVFRCGPHCPCWVWQCAILRSARDSRGQSTLCLLWRVLSPHRDD